MQTARGIITVAELDRRLRRVVESASSSDWVQGEVRGVRRAGSGHAYFVLRDEREEAVVDCVVYRSQFLRCGRHLVEGARVQVSGRATVWAPRGKLQFVAESVRPAGRGALLEALERLKLALAGEGLFERERKRRLPSHPRVVGVVTSAHGAAWHDIQVVALRRSRLRLVLAAAQVQGEAAADSLIRALDLLERYPGLDAIIIGRGGGSLEDLMAFNDERLVRRVAASFVPTVSAVGHEIDVTLCDLVADARAATPSEAAELLVPDGRVKRRELERSQQRLLHAMQARLREDRALLSELRAKVTDPRFVIAEKQQSLDDRVLRLERRAKRAVAVSRDRAVRLEQRLLARHPRAVVLGAQSRLLPLLLRLRHLMTALLEARRQRIKAVESKLQGLSPLGVLERGYAIVLDDRGHALREARAAKPGSRLDVRLRRGRLSAAVLDVEPDS